MEHYAHKLGMFTLSVTGDVSLPLNIISAAMMHLLLVAFMVRAGEEGRWPVWAKLFPRASISSKLA